MKKTKEQKGITLIALILTIVVLMILAAVAINSITNDGIISKAEGAVNKYTEAQKEEQAMLEYYEALLAGTAWTQNGTTVSRNGQTLNVGDTIEIVTATNPTTGEVTESTPYEANNVSEWRVLGAEYGKLLLVSAENVEDEVMLGGAYGGTYEDDTDYDGESEEYECVAGYLNGVEYLNTLCSAYLNTEYADEARSIKVEDINRVTGYDPTKDEEFPDYGTTWTYTMDSSGYVAYSSALESGVSEETIFITPDNKTLGKDVSEVKLTDTLYAYDVGDPEEPAYPVLFNMETCYWLASKCVSCSVDGAMFKLLYVDFAVEGDGDLYSTSSGPYTTVGFGVRAVVSLSSEVQVVKV